MAGDGILEQYVTSRFPRTPWTWSGCRIGAEPTAKKLQVFRGNLLATGQRDWNLASFAVSDGAAG